MSFQGYLDSIQAKTGKTPNDFKKLAEEKGLYQGRQLKATTKAGEIVNWLKIDFDLGHGHAMAIYALLKGIKKRAINKPSFILIAAYVGIHPCYTLRQIIFKIGNLFIIRT